MTEKVQFLSRSLICAFVFCCVVMSAKGQYPIDSIRASRQLKLKQLANDPGAPLGTDDIQHVHYYDPDSTFRVHARVERLHNEPSFRMPTSDGTSKEYVRYAKVRFSLRGVPGELTLYRSLDPFVNPIYRDHLFLPFADSTNGDETYGGGRYIDLSLADIQNGDVVIDFNNAYNPYCAYSSGYRCPMPPAENNLAMAIRAGEKTYTGSIKERPQPILPPQPFTDDECNAVGAGDTTLLLRVIQDTASIERRILRTTSNDVNPGDELLPLLAKRMYLAVTDTLHPGVGIAAPQVGINRNVIWVKRFDKKDEPFELYLNPKITWRSKLLRKGLEGCLSIPDTMGQVLRNYTIHLTYQDIKGNHHEEMIEGFTAVIFQHETDHLYGILFTDRLTEQEESTYYRINDEVNLYLEQRLRRQ